MVSLQQELFRGPSVMTLGCHPTPRLSCETVSGVLMVVGIHGAADVENGYGTLTARDAVLAGGTMPLGASSSRAGECLRERQQRLRAGV